MIIIVASDRGPGMIEVEQLSVSYRGAIALDSVSLQLPPGQQVGLIGPNGAGKSTLIKALLGLVPHRGRVRFWGQPRRRVRHRIAYVPQRSQIDWHYPITAWTVVMTALTPEAGWLRRPNAKAQARAEQALDRVGIGQLRHRPIGQLSGGQQQRVFLARALAQEAQLFLLDEPFTGIDRATEVIMTQIFRELTAQGKTLLISCHAWGDSLLQYDRLLLLNRTLLADGSPQVVANKLPWSATPPPGPDLSLVNPLAVA